MTDAGSEAVLAPSGRAQRVTRRSRRRVGILLAGVALLAACGATAVLSQGSSGPVIRTVTVGTLPYQGITVDEQTGRAFVFNSQDATVSVLDTETGALLRTVSVGQSYAWLAVDRPTGHVVLSSYDGTISMLDARSGSVLRTVTDPASDTRLITVDERTNRVFVGHRDSSTVTVLDGRTGVILRHLATCGGPFALGMSERTGHLFAKCNDGTTDVLDARTGRVLRQNPTNSGSYCSVVADERTNRVFETGNISADMLDAQTGRLLRTWAATSNVNFCMATAVDTRRGWIYTFLDPSGSGPSSGLGGPTNQVVALDGRTGAILHRFRAPTNASALAVDSQTGRLLVGSVGTLDSAASLPTTNGTLSVLDGTTGRVLRTLQVGFTPSDIVIDARRRRALVVSGYSDVNGGGIAVIRRPHEGWWPRTLRQIKQVICCLPFAAPAPPAPTTDGTVTTIDLSRL